MVARRRRRIYFASDRVAESYYNAGDSDLYRVPAAGGAIAKVASIDGTIGSLSVVAGRQAHRVRRHAAAAQPVRSYSQPDLWVVDAAPGSAPKNLTESYDFDVSGGIGGDQSAPRGEQPKPIVWSKDGSSLIIVTAEKGSSNLKRVSVASGAMDPVTSGAARHRPRIPRPTTGHDRRDDLDADEHRRHRDRQSAGGAARRRQITHVNEPLFAEIAPERA